MEKNNRPSWQRPKFAPSEDDPLTGFANSMDVMLVFALGLMLALISQSPSLQRHFKLEKQVFVESGKELLDAPEMIEQIQNGNKSGMESLGQVYRDPKTGKLILINIDSKQN